MLREKHGKGHRTEDDGRQQLEPLVRDSIHAAAIRDFPMLEEQFQSFPDEESIRKRSS
ncbi:hypothetical protein O7606_13395 [Micromonospora sp. WMMD882]|uniref:hypothetical protein n=1 Tax=Micromonospora sp. WMMD882 TaxID=3015151 RepID=UPI00248D3902|nr:hypothetical protein [Micromonospora sp. WMMD882]WBB77295.1 hypothetical protein O7606_13395 [Micromonospora sp. WMMD882]